MGAVLLVHDLKDDKGPFVLKYCRENNDEVRHRFRREARLMQTFAGNNKVVQLLDVDLDHEPPFIIMPFFPDGDLATLRPQIESDSALQERVFLGMVDCVNELHRQGIFHRDIKPQNFLRSGESIMVSDFGMGMELESRTQFTRTSQWWGTPGYMPPEFLDGGGFKNATVESDIFMLGKSFYALITGRDPQFINESLLERPLAFVVDKCCKVEPPKRFNSLAQLRQALVAAYNIILGRTDPLGKGNFVLDQVLDELRREGRFTPEKIEELLDLFGSLSVAGRWAVLQRIPTPLYVVLAEPAFRDRLVTFLNQYEEVVFSEPQGFGYAEVVADAMNEIFKHSQDTGAKAKAFEIAIKMAAHMNRFAAMDTCVSMVDSVAPDDPVGPAIASVITLNPYSFLSAIEPVTLKNAEVRAGVQSIRKPLENSNSNVL
jgi:hypothetical protein